MPPRRKRGRSPTPAAPASTRAGRCPPEGPLQLTGRWVRPRCGHPGVGRWGLRLTPAFTRSPLDKTAIPDAVHATVSASHDDLAGAGAPYVRVSNGTRARWEVQLPEDRA